MMEIVKMPLGAYEAMQQHRKQMEDDRNFFLSVICLTAEQAQRAGIDHHSCLEYLMKTAERYGGLKRLTESQIEARLEK